MGKSVFMGYFSVIIKSEDDESVSSAPSISAFGQLLSMLAA